MSHAPALSRSEMSAALSAGQRVAGAMLEALPPPRTRFAARCAVLGDACGILLRAIFDQAANATAEHDASPSVAPVRSPEDHLFLSGSRNSRSR